ncbi:MAG TPA: hypothetical protein PLO67_03765 [Saprospiraceae bacterium]|nr:hypothetical protein [Saprospiraceae bacterium]HPI07349.1 hypothetical protein [Saprospiraceae bacterium]
MSNIEEQPAPRSRKIVIGVILFLILVGLPGASYLYMRSGWNWRKAAVSELGQYGKIRPAYLILPGGERQNRLESSVAVIHIFGKNPDLTPANKKILDDCERLFTQFGKIGEQIRPDFRLGMIAEGGTAEFTSYKQTLPSADYATWVWTGALDDWRVIIDYGYEQYCKKEGIQPAQEYYAVTDTSGQIRRYYDALDEKQLGRLVEHVAMLLPYVK